MLLCQEPLGQSDPVSQTGSYVTVFLSQKLTESFPTCLLVEMLGDSPNVSFRVFFTAGILGIPRIRMGASTLCKAGVTESIGCSKEISQTFSN